jgi:hypothetical protein
MILSFLNVLTILAATGWQSYSLPPLSMLPDHTESHKQTQINQWADAIATCLFLV